GVPAKSSPFYSINTGFGYAPAGALNAVFWHEGKNGTAALHFRDEPFEQGPALSQIYTQPGSRWDHLIEGGGLGPGTPGPVTGYGSVLSPSLNFRYREGTTGRLMLLGRHDRAETTAVNDGTARRSPDPSPPVPFDRQATLDVGTVEPRRQDGRSVIN